MNGFQFGGWAAEGSPRSDTAIRENETLSQSCAFRFHGSLRLTAARCAARRTGWSSSATLARLASTPLQI